MVNVVACQTCKQTRTAGCKHCHCGGECGLGHAKGGCTLLLTAAAVSHENKRCGDCSKAIRKQATARRKREVEQGQVSEKRQRVAAEEARLAAEREGQRMAEEKRLAEVEAKAERSRRKAAERQAAEEKAAYDRVAAQLREAKSRALTHVQVPRLNRAQMWRRGKAPKRSLGEGGQGSIVEMVTTGGEPVAVKVPKQAEVLDMLNEVRLLHLTAANPNVVRTFGVMAMNSNPEVLCPVLELAEGTLNDLIHSYRSGPSDHPAKPASSKMLLAMAVGVACGLEGLHSMGVLHLDLKPANVLVVKKVAKLADFGLAHYQNPQTSMPPRPLLRVVGGTYVFMAPEHLQARFDSGWGESASMPKRACEKLDVWTFACLLDCMVRLATTPAHANLISRVRATGCEWGGLIKELLRGDHGPTASPCLRVASSDLPPHHPPDDWADVISACAQPRATHRPTMESVRRALSGTAAVPCQGQPRGAVSSSDEQTREFLAARTHLLQEHYGYNAL